MNLLAIIPARGGSKGVPRKNVRRLLGKPLLAYSIEAAVGSTYIDKIVVSTDDAEIAEISKNFNVDVIRRPKELAMDDSPTIDTVMHVLNSLEKRFKIDIVVLLQPTSPVRTSNDIDQAIELFIENIESCDSLVSVKEFEPSPFLSMKIDKGHLKPYFDDKYFRRRRQELPPLFVPNGSIYISTKEKLFENKTFYGKKILPYVMSSKKSVDIDSDLDFVLTEIILRGHKDD